MIVLKPINDTHPQYFPSIYNAAWAHDTMMAMTSVVNGMGFPPAAWDEFVSSIRNGPRQMFVVAVDEATHLPVGWCVWVFHGLWSEEELAALMHLDDEDARVRLPSPSPDSPWASRAPLVKPPKLHMTEEEIAAGKARINAMGAATGPVHKIIRARLIPEGCKCMYIETITVSPAAQGIGIGSALARWGMRRAERTETYVWTNASEAARALYERLGWDVVGTCEVDLDEWDPRPERRREGNWGRYTFTSFRWPAGWDKGRKEAA